MNLTSLAARGRTLLEAALDSTVDYDTLEVTDPTPPTPIASDVRALVVAMGLDPQPIGPNRDDHSPTHQVFLPVAVTDIAEGDLLTVTAGLDAHLDGAELRVTAVIDDGIGAARRVHARRT